MANQEQPKWSAKDFPKITPFHHLPLFSANGTRHPTVAS
jgi:hypothetical protein